jgi:pyruvate dehydrogenase E1 component
MYAEQEDAYYYLTLLNENYPQPAMPKGAADGILKGLHQVRAGGGTKKAPRVQLLGSGAILREVLAAAELLEADWGVAADAWSATSFTELARDGMSCERAARFNPGAPVRPSWVETCLGPTTGPVVAATDYVRAFAEQIRPWVARRYLVLGTDGYGRSDTREKLRRFFEVDRHHVVVAALTALGRDGTVPAARAAEAMAKYGIDPSSPDPWTV